jgi:hypothetical protein
LKHYRRRTIGSRHEPCDPENAGILPAREA